VSDSLRVPRAEKAPALLLYLRESDIRHPGRDVPLPGCRKPSLRFQIVTAGCPVPRK